MSDWGSDVCSSVRDAAFHRGLALGVGCDHAWRVVEDMKVQMDRVRYLSLPQATPTGRLIDQHEAILDAVAARDPGRAEAAIRTHLTEILPRSEERRVGTGCVRTWRSRVSPDP